ncbi:54S ribosomal protein L9, mitochondrial [Sparganum proliferum]
MFLKRPDGVCVGKYPVRNPHYAALKGGPTQLSVEEQIYEEIGPDDERPILEVLLSDDVPGLGERGDLVKVHRNRFWNHLYLLRLAELPTEDRTSQLNAEKREDKSVLCGHAYEVQQRLLNMTLYIPMNPNAQWTLTPNHVKVAFRRLGIMLEEKDITLPESPVTAETLGMFHIHVNIDDLAMVPVESRIFLYQRLDSKTCTRPPANVFRKIRLIDWTADFMYEELRLLPGQSLRPYR